MIAFFVVPMKRDDFLLGSTPTPGRYCAMNDFTPEIRADGGEWSEAEIGGNRAIVKVRADESTLNTIAAEPTFTRLPGRMAAEIAWTPRRKPRYDNVADRIVLDGPFQPTRTIESIEQAVSD